MGAGERRRPDVHPRAPVRRLKPLFRRTARVPSFHQDGREHRLPIGDNEMSNPSRDWSPWCHLGIAAAVMSGLLSTACGSALRVGLNEQIPASFNVEPIAGTALHRVKLTSKAAERIAVKTAQVRQDEITREGNKQIRKSFRTRRCSTTPIAAHGCTPAPSRSSSFATKSPSTTSRAIGRCSRMALPPVLPS